MNDIDECLHLETENGFCQFCGIKVCHLEIEAPVCNDSGPSLDDYITFINYMSTIPDEVKSEICKEFSNATSFPKTIRAALQKIYCLTISIVEKMKQDNKECAFIKQSFEKEITNFVRTKFGRKNLNQILRSKSSHSTIEFISPLRYVDSVCASNNCRDIAPQLKQVFIQMMERDKEARIYELSPEPCVSALIYMFHQKYEILGKKTLNTFSKENGLGPIILKNIIKSLREIIDLFEIEY